MKRLLAFLLICLLPMQVFAGLLTYRTAVDAVALQAQFDQLTQSAALLAADDVAPALTLVADDTDIDDDSSDFADSDDFSTHAGVGDEPVLHSAQVFVFDSATLAPSLHSDAASQPPFLPPAGRPPRV
jgi:hypothetical protein